MEWAKIIISYPQAAREPEEGEGSQEITKRTHIAQRKSKAYEVSFEQNESQLLQTGAEGFS